ncbi:sugar-transfer associated ATP-grasp domain-containing protein, partial [Ectothiorhodospira haloalkaliphila]
MMFKKLRILGLGFTDEEYELYGLGGLSDPARATQYLSNRWNDLYFRPKINRCQQRHVLEDKWVTHLYFLSLSLPVPKTYGMFHEKHGVTAGGRPLRTADDLRDAFIRNCDFPTRLVFKPRGGRQGQNIIVCEVGRGDGESVHVLFSGKKFSLQEFTGLLPRDAFLDYGGGYDGWLVQEYIDQHPFMKEIGPYTVNTFRVITFIDQSGHCKVQMAALRLGRQGSSADNWDKGGLSVAVDLKRGRLGKGVSKPSYGGRWTAFHPDTQVHLEGREVPGWNSIVEVCERAAKSISGVRSVGWDIAYTPEGPVIIEGNAVWSLPLTQVHTNGYLTDDVR